MVLGVEGEDDPDNVLRKVDEGRGDVDEGRGDVAGYEGVVVLG